MYFYPKHYKVRHNLEALYIVLLKSNEQKDFEILTLFRIDVT